MFISSNAQKDDIKKGIISILESYDFVISPVSIGKFNRMRKADLNQFYNHIRYQWNNGFIKAEVRLLYGIIITEKVY